MDKGILIIVSAPSGTGKSTILHRLMEMRENLERTEELEYLLEQQENTIRVLQERQNVSNERGARRQVGLDLDHITPAFQREWQLEKMRYGLD